MVEPSPEKAQRILAALRDCGFDSIDLSVDDLAEPARIVQLGLPPNRIDLMTSIDGVAFSEVWNGRVEGNYGGVRAFFIGLKELIRNKRAAGRPQDLADLSWLERL